MLIFSLLFAASCSLNPFGKNSDGLKPIPNSIPRSELSGDASLFGGDLRFKQWQSSSSDNANVASTKKDDFPILSMDEEPEIKISLLKQLFSCPIPKLRMSKAVLTSNVEMAAFAYCVTQMVDLELGEKPNSYPDIPAMDMEESAFNFYKELLKGYMAKFIPDEGDVSLEDKLMLIERLFVATKYRLMTQIEIDKAKLLLTDKGFKFTAKTYLNNWYHSDFYKRYFDYSIQVQEAYKSYQVYGIIQDSNNQPLANVKYFTPEEFFTGYNLSGRSLDSLQEIQLADGSSHTYNFYLQFYYSQDSDPLQSEYSSVPVLATKSGYDIGLIEIQPGLQQIITDISITMDIFELPPDYDPTDPFGSDDGESSWPNAELLQNPYLDSISWSLDAGAWVNECEAPQYSTELDTTTVAGYDWQDYVSCLFQVDMAKLEPTLSDYYPLIDKQSAFNLVYVITFAYMETDNAVSTTDVQILSLVYSAITFQDASASMIESFEQSLKEVGFDMTLSGLLEKWYYSAIYEYYDYSKVPHPLKNYYTVSGVVTDPSQAALGGVQISLIDPIDEKLYEITTDSNGSFSFRHALVEDLVNSDFVLQLSKDGYADLDKGFSFGTENSDSREKTLPIVISPINTIAPESGGQIVSGAEEISIVVKPNSVNEPVQFVISAIDINTHPDNQDNVSAQFTIEPSYAFNQDIEIEIKLPSAMMDDQEQLNDLMILSRESEDEPWQELRSSFDHQTGVMKVQTNHFSMFQIYSYGSIAPKPSHALSEVFLSNKNQISYPANLPELANQSRQELLKYGWKSTIIDRIDWDSQRTDLGLADDCPDTALDCDAFHFDNVLNGPWNPGGGGNDLASISIENIFLGNQMISGTAKMDFQAEYCKINPTASSPKIHLNRVNSTDIDTYTNLRFNNVKISYRCVTAKTDYKKVCTKRKWFGKEICVNVPVSIDVTSHCSDTFHHTADIFIYDYNLRAFRTSEPHNSTWVANFHDWGPDTSFSLSNEVTKSLFRKLYASRVLDKLESQAEKNIADHVQDSLRTKLKAVSFDDSSCYDPEDIQVSNLQLSRNKISPLGVYQYADTLWQTPESGFYTFQINEACTENNNQPISGTFTEAGSIVSRRVNASELVDGENTIRFCLTRPNGPKLNRHADETKNFVKIYNRTTRPQFTITNNPASQLSAYSAPEGFEQNTSVKWKVDVAGRFYTAINTQCNSNFYSSLYDDSIAAGEQKQKDIKYDQLHLGSYLAAKDRYESSNKVYLCVADEYGTLGQKIVTMGRVEYEPKITIISNSRDYISTTGYTSSVIKWKSDHRVGYTIKVNGDCDTGITSSGNNGTNGENSLAINQEVSSAVLASQLRSLNNASDIYTILICLDDRDNTLSNNKGYEIILDQDFPVITPSPNSSADQFKNPITSSPAYVTPEAVQVTLTCEDNYNCDNMSYVMDVIPMDLDAGTSEDVKHFSKTAVNANKSTPTAIIQRVIIGQIVSGQSQNGDYSLSYTAKDLAGNTISEEFSPSAVRMDDRTPVPVLISISKRFISPYGFEKSDLQWQSNVTGEYAIEASVAINDGNDKKIVDSGQIQGSTDISSSINSASVIASDLDYDGNYAININIQGYNRRNGENSGAIYIYRDSVAPVVSSYKQSNEDQTEYHAFLTLDGENNPFRTVYSLSGTPSIDKEGNYSGGQEYIGDAIELPDYSKNQLRAIAVDKAGNIGPVHKQEYIVDTMDTIPLTNVSPGEITLSRSLDIRTATISWTVTRTDLDYQLVKTVTTQTGQDYCNDGDPIASGTTVYGANSANISVDSFPDMGDYDIYVCVSNLHGKASYSSNAVKVTVSEQNPRLTVNTVSDYVISKKPEFNKSIINWHSDQKGYYMIKINSECPDFVSEWQTSVVAYNNPGNTVNTEILSTQTGMGSGRNDVTICFTNLNDNTVYRINNITVDTTGPDLEISPNGGTFGDARDIYVSCSDHSGCDNISYTTDGTNPNFTGVGTVLDPEKASFKIGSGGNGSYTAKIVAMDSVGNVSSARNVSITINDRIPNIVIDNPQQDFYLSEYGRTEMDLVWQSSNKAGDYRIQINSGCSSIIEVDETRFIGHASSDTNVLTEIQFGDLRHGPNSVYICFNPDDQDGERAAYEHIVHRDDFAPVADNWPGEGAYGTVQKVELSCSDNCKMIIFTEDDSDPEFGSDGSIKNGQVYNENSHWFTPDSAETILKFMAIDKALNTSEVQREFYEVDSRLATVSIANVNRTTITTRTDAGGFDTSSISWLSSFGQMRYAIKIGDPFYERQKDSLSPCKPEANVLTTIIPDEGEPTLRTPEQLQPILTQIKADMLDTNDESNKKSRIYLCVANFIGDYGYTTIDIIRDDRAPVITEYDDKYFTYMSSKTEKNNTLLQWTSSLSGDYRVVLGDSCSGISAIKNNGKVDQTAPEETRIAATNLTSINAQNNVSICVRGYNGLTGKATFNFYRDEIAPTLSFSPDGAFYLEAKKITINCNDNLSGCENFMYTDDKTDPDYQIPVNGSIEWKGENDESFQFDKQIGNGKTFWRFKAKDRAGNISGLYNRMYWVSNDGFILVNISGLTGVYISDNNGVSFENIYSGRSFSSPFISKYGKFYGISSNGYFSQNVFISNRGTEAVDEENAIQDKCTINMFDYQIFYDKKSDNILLIDKDGHICYGKGNNWNSISYDFNDYYSWGVSNSRNNRIYIWFDGSEHRIIKLNMNTGGIETIIGSNDQNAISCTINECSCYGSLGCGCVDRIRYVTTIHDLIISSWGHVYAGTYPCGLVKYLESIDEWGVHSDEITGGYGPGFTGMYDFSNMQLNSQNNLYGLMLDGLYYSNQTFQSTAIASLDFGRILSISNVEDIIPLSEVNYELIFGLVPNGKNKVKIDKNDSVYITTSRGLLISDNISNTFRGIPYRDILNNNTSARYNATVFVYK